MIVDFHSHILPHMDDGSGTTNESIRMIIEESLQGVDRIVLTPHFYAETSKLDHFLEKRDGMLEHMHEILCAQTENDKDEAVRKARGMTFYAGAEVCYFAGIGESEEISKLSIHRTSRGKITEDTHVFLLEMPFAQWNDQIYRDVKALIEHHKLTVVIAHMERYIRFQKQKDVMKKVLSLPVILQCNAGPLTHFLQKKDVLQLFQNGASLLGTDCHNMTSRMPNLQQGREVLEKKLGKEILEKIDLTGAQLLGE